MFSTKILSSKTAFSISL